MKCDCVGADEEPRAMSEPPDSSFGEEVRSGNADRPSLGTMENGDTISWNV